MTLLHSLQFSGKYLHRKNMFNFVCNYAQFRKKLSTHLGKYSNETLFKIHGFLTMLMVNYFFYPPPGP